MKNVANPQVHKIHYYGMNPRTQISSLTNNSYSIRQEIQRFESVHPSIYAIYDIIDHLQDPHIQIQLREHVVCIEGKPLKAHTANNSAF